MTPEQIRAEQEANVAAIEAKIAAGTLGEQTESASAACASIRKAWELNALYDGVAYEGGKWFAVLYVPIEVAST